MGVEQEARQNGRFDMIPGWVPILAPETGRRYGDWLGGFRSLSMRSIILVAFSFSGSSWSDFS